MLEAKYTKYNEGIISIYRGILDGKCSVGNIQYSIGP
jgi:hypothetical protein